MSYWHIQRTAQAKAYLDEREASDRIRGSSPQLVISREWLDDHKARARRTQFNWSPRWPVVTTAHSAQQPPGDDNGKGDEEN